jgi:uncharacterized protein YukE
MAATGIKGADYLGDRKYSHIGTEDGTSAQLATRTVWGGTSAKRYEQQQGTWHAAYIGNCAQA